MSKAKTKSNFEKRAISRYENDGVENVEITAERAYRQAKSKIDVQLAQLEGKKIELENDIDDKNEEVDTSQFSAYFTLENYDNVTSELEKLQDELDSVKATIENRQAILKAWK